MSVDCKRCAVFHHVLYSARVNGVVMGSGKEVRPKQMGQIFSATDVPVGKRGEVFAFNQVDLAVLDRRDLGEGLVYREGFAGTRRRRIPPAGL